MKTFTTRCMLGLAMATFVAGGMLLTAKPLSAAEDVCWEIAHYQKKKGTFEFIVVSESGFWNGHAKHGDWVNNYEVPCPVDGELPPA